MVDTSSVISTTDLQNGMILDPIGSIEAKYLENKNNIINNEIYENEDKMDFVLSHTDKLIIISVACILIVVTLVLTICFVSPWCYLYKWISFGSKKKSKLNSYPTLSAAESKHFHLSIVPVYGSKYNDSFKISSNQNNNIEEESINQFEHLTNLAEKTRRKYSFKNVNNNGSINADVNKNGGSSNCQMQMNCPKIETVIYYKLINESIIRIYIQIKRIYDLQFLSVNSQIQQEPSPYLVVYLSGYRFNRKSITIKGVQNELFRTETVKRSFDVTFSPVKTFISEELPRNLLKDAFIKFRLMNEERYANDYCLAELNISLKKLPSFDYLNDQNDCPLDHNENDFESNIVQFKSTTFQMLPIKEIKGELLAGFCYLPTSRRINITIIKGNIQNSLLRINGNNNNNSSTNNHQVFYIKALMFNNGKLIKKKKTSSSIRMSWNKNETISFDLPNDNGQMQNDQVTFMLILAFKMQDSHSPESPDSPENSTYSTTNMIMSKDDGDDSAQQQQQQHSLNLSSKVVASAKNNFNMRKEFYIGHFILDRLTWTEEILKKPRKQIIKWFKIY